MKYALLIAYLACIVGANWAIERYGFVSVGFGLMAPAAVYFAGLAFSVRDGLQRTAGRRWVVGGILAGAALSYLIAPSFAVASGVAFLVSELADMAVYTPLHARRPYLAVLASNTVGAVIDSWIFLYLAFGSIAFWRGQVVGKLWTVIPVLILLWLWRHREVSERVRSPRPAV